MILKEIDEGDSFVSREFLDQPNVLSLESSVLMSESPSELEIIPSALLVDKATAFVPLAVPC